MAGKGSLQVSRLISEVHRRPELWDRQHPQHHNKSVLELQWDTVASMLDMNGNDEARLKSGVVLCIFSPVPNGGRRTRAHARAQACSAAAAAAGVSRDNNNAAAAAGPATRRRRDGLAALRPLRLSASRTSV